MSAPLRTPAPHAGHVAAAALVPPLGLHLAGAGPRDFWIGTGLTVLGFVPGAAFALFRVVRPGAGLRA